MAKFLQLALWNANGLTQHTEELKIFISIHNIDVLLCSPQRTSKRSSSEPHWATRQQQAIAKTPAKLSAYQIPSVIVVFVTNICRNFRIKVVFVVLVFKVQSVSLVPKSNKRPWTY
jgi:hypothetical protein